MFNLATITQPYINHELTLYLPFLIISTYREDWTDSLMNSWQRGSDNSSSLSVSLTARDEDSNIIHLFYCSGKLILNMVGGSNLDGEFQVLKHGKFSACDGTDVSHQIELGLKSL